VKNFILILVLLIASWKISSATNESICADLVVAEIKVLNPPADAATLKPYWEAICKGILNHLKADAVILPTTFLDSLGQPVTGTGTLQ